MVFAQSGFTTQSASVEKIISPLADLIPSDIALTLPLGLPDIPCFAFALFFSRYHNWHVRLCR